MLAWAAKSKPSPSSAAQRRPPRPLLPLISTGAEGEDSYRQPARAWQRRSSKPSAFLCERNIKGGPPDNCPVESYRKEP